VLPGTWRRGKETVDQRVQRRPAVRLRDGCGDERRVKRVHLAVEHRGEDLGDPPEVVRHRSQRDLAGRGDVPHRGGEQAPVGDDGTRSLDDERPPDLGRVPLPFDHHAGNVLPRACHN